MINIASILRKPHIIGSLPSVGIPMEMPIITYNLDNPIASKIFNYSQFVNDFRFR